MFSCTLVIFVYKFINRDREILKRRTTKKTRHLIYVYARKYSLSNKVNNIQLPIPANEKKKLNIELSKQILSNYLFKNACTTMFQA